MKSGGIEAEAVTSQHLTFWSIEHEGLLSRSFKAAFGLHPELVESSARLQILGV
jgi:hypothetical protein